MPKATYIYVAHHDSRHFTWHGFGRTRKEAIDSLILCWNAHASRIQESDPYGMAFWHDYEFKNDVSVYKVKLGEGYRDWQEW